MPNNKTFYKYIIYQRTDGSSWEIACDSYEDDEIGFKTLSTCKKRAQNDMKHNKAMGYEEKAEYYKVSIEEVK